MSELKTLNDLNVDRADIRFNGKSKPKDVEFKHGCGCITMKYKDGVVFKKMCKRHQLNRKFIWIVIQHPTEDSK